MKIDRLQTPDSIKRLAIKVPETHSPIEINGKKAIQYITENYMYSGITTVANEILDSNTHYDRYVVNTRGGHSYFHMLCRNWRSALIPVLVEYHGKQITKPIPESIDQKEKVLIVDDILDTGKTLMAMLEDHPNADIVLIAIKSDVEGQIPIWSQVENLWTVVVTENVTLGGNGSDFADSWVDPERHYGGLVYKDR